MPYAGFNQGAIGDVEVHVRAAIAFLAVRHGRARRFGNRQQFESTPASVGFSFQNPTILRHDRIPWVRGIGDHLA